MFLSAAPLATTFSGALAYGITSGNSRLANWRLLFLVEGLPTICMVPVAYFFLPDTPEKARFLTEEERAVARSRGVRQVGEKVRVGGIVWKEVGAALLDVKCWFTALMYFSCNLSFFSSFVRLRTRSGGCDCEVELMAGLVLSGRKESPSKLSNPYFYLFDELLCGFSPPLVPYIGTAFQKRKADFSIVGRIFFSASLPANNHK